MRRTRLVLAAGLASLTASCDPAAPLRVPTTPTAPPSVAALELIAENKEFYVGVKTAVFVQAFDASGRLAHSDSAVMRTSDPSVISLSTRHVTVMRRDGSEARTLRQVLTMIGAGTAVLRASIGGVSDSLVLKVLPVPPFSAALGVDSFTVIEYRAACAWDCPYLAYAPLLKLRVPGGSPVELRAVQFDVSTKSTGWCNVGQLQLNGGFAGHINAIDPYLWNNDMIFVQLDGVPLVPGPARARVIFRDSLGMDGMTEVQGEIQRMVASPVFPGSPFAGTGWSCAFHLESLP